MAIDKVPSSSFRIAIFTSEAVHTSVIMEAGKP
jgi:hypothetical protein